MLGRHKMLGLAVTRGAATASEVVVTKGHAQTVRAAEFVFPEGVSLDEPERLGKALREFLLKGGFTASRCVVGMEAAWLTAREKTLPPGSADSVAGILSVAVEREFASERKDLVFDYTAGAGADGRPVALLVAAPRRHVDGLVAMARGAGLTVAGVTSSTLVLPAPSDGSPPAGGSPPPEQLVLHAFRGGVEMAVRSGGQPLTLGRLSVSPPEWAWAGTESAAGWFEELSGELRRVVYARPGSPDAGPARELLVWNEAGLDPRAWDTLAAGLGMPVRLCGGANGRSPASAGAARTAGQQGAATALAMVGLRSTALPVDFLHSRLAPRRRLTAGRKAAWAAGAVGVVVLVGALLVLDVYQTERDVADLEARTAENAPSVDEARQIVAKAAFAQAWYRKQPRLLECLRELTLAFPVEGRIWATNVSVQEDLRGVVSGKAATESLVLDVLDRLKANPRFAEVKPLYLREAGSGGREVAFAMSFHFSGANRP